jgi:hypothetical protein
MILPTKHLTPAQSLLGVSSRMLARLRDPRTVNQLWEESRSDLTIGSFDRFVLALDLLFLLGAIELQGGMLRVHR